MPEQVVMPRLSDTMTEGTVSKWLKHPGDEVKKGEPLVEIETDKANIELEAYASGRLARIILSEGQSAPVGQLIGEIALPGEEPTAGSAPLATSAGAQAPARAAVAVEAPAAQPGQGPKPAAATAVAMAPEAPDVLPANGKVRASPMARRLARELGVELAVVHGSGPLGRIQKEDVEAAAKNAGAGAPSAAPAGPEVETVALTRIQQTIARRMVEAKSSVPHFYVTMDVDMRRAMENLEELNDGQPKEQQVTVNDVILRACALTLKDFPDVNSSYDGGKLVRHQRIHVGFAVAVDGGLIEPVIRDADRKGLRALAAESKALSRKMREGRAELQDYEGGTFSISNLGMYGVDEFSAIINPPHSAILAVGAVQDQPVVVNGQLAVSKRVKLTLSADHRVFYGATAAEFLRAVKQRLEKPLSLFA